MITAQDSWDVKVGRRTIHLTKHVLEQWWRRRARLEPDEPPPPLPELVNMARYDLCRARWSHDVPVGFRPLTCWHRGRANGFLLVEDGAFIVNKDEAPHPGLYAVTFLSYDAPERT